MMSLIEPSVVLIASVPGDSTRTSLEYRREILQGPALKETGSHYCPQTGWGWLYHVR